VQRGHVEVGLGPLPGRRDPVDLVLGHAFSVGQES
jgi:hypothetical protein